MGRGAHGGCNRTRVAWAGGTVAALASAWLLLKAAVDFVLVIVFYGMLGLCVYRKRELLSSYCRPPGVHQSGQPWCSLSGRVVTVLSCAWYAAH